jgi:hypothetical protein
MPLCGPHDRWKHANHIRSRRATSGRLFLIKPDGTTVLPIGAREPNWAEPPPTETATGTATRAATGTGTATGTRSSSDDPWTAFPDAVDFDDVTVTVRSGGPPHHWYFDGVRLIRNVLAAEPPRRDD